jgi:hypothetical protein
MMRLISAVCTKVKIFFQASLNVLKFRVYGGENRLMKSAVLKPSSLQDPRFLQIFLLSVFLVYGNLFLGWYSSAGVFAAALLSTVACQYAWIKVKRLDMRSLRSAVISGLGLCLLLKTDSWMVMT